MLYINSILYIYSNQIWQSDLFSYSKLRTYETTSLLTEVVSCRPLEIHFFIL